MTASLFVFYPVTENQTDSGFQARVPFQFSQKLVFSGHLKKNKDLVSIQPTLEIEKYSSNCCLLKGPVNYERLSLADRFFQQRKEQGAEYAKNTAGAVRQEL